MRTTRSVTRKATAIVSDETTVTVEETVTVVARSNRKRKASSATTEPGQKRPRATKSSTKPTDKQNKVSSPAIETIHIEPIPAADGEELVPAVLTFSFEHAKRHLIGADPRFEDVFNRVSCKPFQELERVDPFRTLAHSIL
uniref:Zn(2)-C6 fungal-type domain-containing protein n=1 Tax=Ganoderma boninense TaxID=34458 RepID=A0A5K1K3F9_9APHY|nr:Zn(2)-C6 fungal-type domain-containing protein [Ganoderma boninense]